MRKSVSFYLAVLVSLLCMAGCSDLVPLWSGTQKLQDLTLYYSKPVEFTGIEVPGDSGSRQVAYLELAITYYTPIGRTELPLHLVFENVGSTEKFPLEFDKIVVPLKVDDKWQGKQEEYETDYTLTTVVIPFFELPAGKYRLKIYGNDPKTEKIYGVVKIAARIYPLEKGKSA